MSDTIMIHESSNNREILAIIAKKHSWLNSMMQEDRKDRFSGNFNCLKSCHCLFVQHNEICHLLIEEFMLPKLKE